MRRHRAALLGLFCTVTMAATGAPASAQADSKLSRAWVLGSKLSVAAALQSQGEPALAVRQFNIASATAAGFGIKLPALPARTGNKIEDSASALNYLLNQTGGPIGSILMKNFGAEHAAVFEVALKSNILLIMYGPDESTTKTIAGVMRSRTTQARFLSGLTAPLLALIDRQAAFDHVKKELFDLHDLAPRVIAVIEHSRDGEALYKAKDYAGSAAAYTRAMAIDPDGAEFYFGRGRANMQLNNNPQAIADYTKAIQLEASSTNSAANLSVAYHNRGLLYGMAGKNALAIADLTQAIKIRPEYASAYKVRGLVYQKMGNAAAARKDLETAEKLQPGITR